MSNKKAAIIVGVFVVILLSTIKADAVISVPSQITSCYLKTTGVMRHVANNLTCKKTETRVSWNQQGARGTTGIRGATGLTGLKGTDGITTGPQGPTGLPGTRGTGSTVTIVSNYKLVSFSSPITWIAEGYITTCPVGAVAVGGGGYGYDQNIYWSYPSDNNGYPSDRIPNTSPTSWTVIFGQSDGGSYGQAYATCLS